MSDEKGSEEPKKIPPIEGEDKPKDELEETFENTDEKKEDLVDELAVQDDRVRYLKNIGIPSQMRIDKQRAMQWYKEDGVQVRLETINDMEDKDDAKLAKEYGINVPEGQKCWIYFYNGEYKSNRITFSGDSFKVLSYPHVLNFPIGTNKRDEKRYSLLVGKVEKFDRSGDADTILERFNYVVETDKDGKWDKESNNYLKALKRPPKKLSKDTRVDWGSMDTVDIDQVQKQSPDAKPVTLSESKDSGESGEMKD